MKRKLRLFGLALTLVSLVSCDSREDWFEKNSWTPDLVYSVNGVTDTIKQGEVRKIVIDLHPSNCKYVEISSEDRWTKIYSDTAFVNLSLATQNGKTEIKEIIFQEYDENDGVLFSPNGLSHYPSMELQVNAVLNTSKYTEKFFDCDTAPRLWATRLTSFHVLDAFGNKTYYSIETNFIGATPPTPVLEVSKIKGMEYTLSMANSYDKDGEVRKYEWCVDGNILPYDVKDIRLQDHASAHKWGAGKPAYGGTYITATTINSINHSFQEPGEHIVYYRCMDNLGVWSLWYSQIINIEE